MMNIWFVGYGGFVGYIERVVRGRDVCGNVRGVVTLAMRRNANSTKNVGAVRRSVVIACLYLH